MMELSPVQRKQLKSLAHHLDPAVMVGKNGVTDNLIKAANDSLEAHELIKVKFLEFKDKKGDLSKEIAQKSKSTVVTIIGNVMILYRRQEDDEKRKIELD